MVEAALAQLGQQLVTKFGLPNRREHIGFLEKEYFFSSVSQNNLPLSLPCVTYYVSQIVPSSDIRPGIKVLVSFGVNEAAAKVFSVCMVDLTISLAFMASSVADFFRMGRSYFGLKQKASLDFQFTEPKLGTDFKFNTAAKDFEPLTTPAGFFESKDFESRGKIHSAEGGFTLPSFILLDATDEPIVRNIQVDWTLITVAAQEAANRLNTV